MTRRTIMAVIAVVLAVAGAIDVAAQAPDDGHNHAQAIPVKNFLSADARAALDRLMVQDFQGRMKPMDTLSRESVMKLVKRSSFDGWDPLDTYLSWNAHSDFWFNQEFISVRNHDLRGYLGVSEGQKRISPAFVFDASGRYRLTDAVEDVHRTPDKRRTKMQRKLLSLDERINVFYMAVRGLNLRMFPVPDDPNHKWISPADFDDQLDADTARRFRGAYDKLRSGLVAQDNAAVLEGTRLVGDIQHEFGGRVFPSNAALKAEMRLNRLQPFTWSTVPYMLAFGVLLLAYAWGLARRRGRPYGWRHPLYAIGMLFYVAALLFQAYGYVLRWIAAGHAPLSNGYESLIFISVVVGAAGFRYEAGSRRGSMGAFAAMLTALILGIAMLPSFDPAISPLVPVLASNWLIIHVTVITASYGILTLAAIVALAILVLHLFKGPNRQTLRMAIIDLHQLHWKTLVTGLAFLSVGTFLGGVWANESWGRYWGWDPKETWALVTILVYAFVSHFRFVDWLNKPLNIAAGSFLALGSIGMTYFGVNYFLSGLHSYAQGDAPEVPKWVFVMAAIMVAIVLAAFRADSARSWKPAKAKG